MAELVLVLVVVLVVVARRTMRRPMQIGRWNKCGGKTSS
jgi:hypothetical protein